MPGALISGEWFSIRSRMELIFCDCQGMENGFVAHGWV
jgi:hypothetical protein